MPPAALTIPAHGWVNLHFSLLPAWRGAAPVQHAIWRGDEVTGASTFALEEGLDTGPVYGIVTETIRPDDTSGALLDRLAHAGSGLLVATLDAIEAGAAHPVPQAGEASLAPKITVDDARVRWDLPALGVDRQVRACTPAPGRLDDLPRRAARRRAGHRLADDADLAPGRLRVGKRDVLVGTATQAVRLGLVRPAGKREMPAADWARGRATHRRGRARVTDKPRAAALELLRAVREDDAYANLALPQLLHGYGLSGRDAAFATELAYGTLRGKGWYDAVLASCVTRPWDKVEPALQDVLRLGAHQILSMRVPDHAAVDSSCVLAAAGHAARSRRPRRLRQRGAAQGRGGRHGRLGAAAAGRPRGRRRRVARHPVLAPGLDRPRLRDALGARRSELPELLAADNAPARPTLVARPGRMTVDELRRPAGGGARPAVAVRRHPRRRHPRHARVRARRPGGRAGRGQPAGGARPGARRRRRRRGAVARPLRRARRQGGPARRARARAGRAPRRGRAAAHRADLVEASFAPGSTSLVLTGDARRAPWGDRLFDRVLVDAPCTGLGALRRRPEARWRRTTADLAALGPSSATCSGPASRPRARAASSPT